MTDQTFGTTNRATSRKGGADKAGEPKSAAEEVTSAAREWKDKVSEMAGNSSDTVKEHASDLVDAAKDVSSQAADKLKQTVQGQKNAGAEYVGSLAETMRRAAREFDSDLPIAGTYIRKAASQVEVAADSIRNGSFNDLVEGAQAFARQRPAAFLGIAMLTGFGVVRFLKSSAENSSSDAEIRTGGGSPAGEVNYGVSADEHAR
jgi:gas vesicle protein